MEPSPRPPAPDAKNAAHPAASPAAEVGTIPALPLPAAWDRLLEETARRTLENSALPSFLMRQRWFGGKARRLKTVRIVDWTPLVSHPAPAYLLLMDVEFTDGDTDLYFLPLAMASAVEAGSVNPSPGPHVLARLNDPHGEVVLQDALADPAACAALLSAIAEGREFSTRQGFIRAFHTAAYEALRGDPGTPLAATLGPATSSNSLVFYGGRLLLKLFRRLEGGINPDFEIGRFLTESGTFERIPKAAGAMEYHRPGSAPVTLAILQQLVPNQGDGWRHALEEIGRYFERASAGVNSPDLLGPDHRSLLERADRDPPPAAQATIGAYLHAAATLGQRTAELHLALAGSTDDPAFAPEPLTSANLAGLAAGVLEQGRQALTALTENLGRVPEAIGSEARRLLNDGPDILKHLAEPPRIAAGVSKIRCHGDYHLGQVLWVDHDFVILDFEGEPTRSVEERRAKQSPLKDVAGMLRSFNYAAYAGLFARAQADPQDFERLMPWADLWERWTAAAFLRTYRASAARATFLPADPGQFLALLQSFVLEKALYELVYELNNRPDWVRIPLRGILSLLEQEVGGHSARPAG